MSDKKSKSSHRFYPAALTIAGSDSGGGAGIEADLRTFNAFGVYGCCAITALTAQNPRRILRIDKMEPEVVRAQIDAVMECASITYIKTGMLGDAGIVQAVAEAVKKYKFKLICDPVILATSGNALFEKESLACLCDQLLPHALWITPNVPEAELLLGGDFRIRSEADLFAAAEALNRRFGASILLKGGHLDLPEAVDAVYRDGRSYRLVSPKVEIPVHAGHGTGCTLSAALTAGLTLDYPWKQALCEAKSFVLGSLSQNIELASGVFAMYPPTEDCYDLIKLELK